MVTYVQVLREHVTLSPKYSQHHGSILWVSWEPSLYQAQWYLEGELDAASPLKEFTLFWAR